ncbi:hypothetical protein LCGC14_2851280, partial [marine sediment metagenome]
MIGVMNDYMEARLNWGEMIVNIAPQNRGNFPKPTLWDKSPQMNNIRQELGKLKVDESSINRARTYNAKSRTFMRY